MPTAVGAKRGPRHVFTELCMAKLCMADLKSHRAVPGDPPGALHARWGHQGRGTEIPGTGKGLREVREMCSNATPNRPSAFEPEPRIPPMASWYTQP